ncbi:hypothetical protein [Micromonospora sp. NPDC004704]
MRDLAVRLAALDADAGAALQVIAYFDSAVLERIRGRAPATDPAAVELVVDASAPADVRLQAARRLGLPVDGTAYAVALASGESRLAAAGTPPPRTRAGIGPTVPLLDLPESHRAARTALRFAAEGTDEDPGETLVHFEELGGLAVLAAVPDPAGVSDVRALEHAAGGGRLRLQLALALRRLHRHPS